MADEPCIIKDKYEDVVTIKLERTNYNDELTEEERGHVTETELDHYEDFDYIIENDSTIEERKAEYFASKMLLGNLMSYYADLPQNMDFQSIMSI